MEGGAGGVHSIGVGQGREGRGVLASTQSVHMPMTSTKLMHVLSVSLCCEREDQQAYRNPERFTFS